MTNFTECVEDLRKHLDTASQNWLLGAGVSKDACIPLMYPLTERVEEIIIESNVEKSIALFKALKQGLADDSHIEHYLSQIGDLIAISDRTRARSTTVSAEECTSDDLNRLYRQIVSAIGKTVRYGYSKDPLEVGTSERPLVQINYHIAFVRALFGTRSNLMSRSKIKFFTTNYDTLLEDALALEHFDVIDGFSGGSLGFWNPEHEFYKNNKNAKSCYLYKLHGSIDWVKSTEFGLVRMRYGTNYINDLEDIMIYPQATKYVETQKDPFSSLFSGFRRALNAQEDNVLITCGYSFSDDHINAEIEIALSNPNSRTTMLAFVREQPKEGQIINTFIDRLLSKAEISSRIYVIGNNGLYQGSTSLIPTENGTLDWWTFSGLTDFIAQ